MLTIFVISLSLFFVFCFAGLAFAMFGPQEKSPSYEDLCSFLQNADNNR